MFKTAVDSIIPDARKKIEQLRTFAAEKRAAASKLVSQAEKLYGEAATAENEAYCAEQIVANLTRLGVGD